MIFNGGGEKTLSDPDATGQAMIEFYLNKPMKKENPVISIKNEEVETHLERCPTCTEESLEISGGCEICHTPGCTHATC